MPVKFPQLIRLLLCHHIDFLGRLFRELKREEGQASSQEHFIVNITLYNGLNVEDNMGTSTHTHLCNKLFLFFLFCTFLATPSVSVQASVPHMSEVFPHLLVRLGRVRFAVFTFTIAVCTIYFLKGTWCNASHLPSNISRCRTIRSFPLNWPQGLKEFRGILNQVFPLCCLTSLLQPKAKSLGNISDSFLKYSFPFFVFLLSIRFH